MSDNTDRILIYSKILIILGWLIIALAAYAAYTGISEYGKLSPIFKGLYGMLPGISYKSIIVMTIINFILFAIPGLLLVVAGEILPHILSIRAELTDINQTIKLYESEMKK